MDYHLNEDYSKIYKNLKLIGTGEFTNVYRAENKNKELRAIKIFKLEEIKIQIKKDNSSDINEIINNIKNEIQNMKICEENNINSIKCYEIFQTENEFAIILELCNKSLREDILVKSFNPKEIFEIVNQLNNTFKIMKEKKIVHRDLKPDNILIKIENKKPIIKLCDYGISIIDKYTKLTSYKGTNEYMAPEIMEEKQYNYKCDLWSLGIIIYELYFQERPFKGKDTKILKSIEIKETI